MSVRAALDIMLSIHGREMTITRTTAEGDLTGTIRLAPSNYFRNLAGPDAVTMEGKEFVISKTALTSAGFTNLKKGDRLTDSEIGINVISEIREMFDIGGVIMGYRIRTS
jgi:hypothetical protein